jgi:hypothetical protein
VLCNEHGHLIYTTNMPSARELMKDPTAFCMVCRCIAGEAGPHWEAEAGLTSEEIATVWNRVALYQHDYVKGTTRRFRDAVTIARTERARVG